MTRFRDYLRFLLRSTNQHGVHSPFVFQLVTRGLYDRTNKPVHGALHDLAPLKDLPEKYFRGLNNCMYHLYGEHIPEVTEPGPDPAESATSPGLIFLNLTKDLPLNSGQLADLMNNDTLLLVKKNGTHPLWEALQACESVHLTIDCFRFGLAFKRPRQVKENFTIRL